METLSIKVDLDLLNKIDSSLTEFGYGTRTDFIREAIRDKLKALRKEQLLIKNCTRLEKKQQRN